MLALADPGLSLIRARASVVLAAVVGWLFARLWDPLVIGGLGAGRRVLGRTLASALGCAPGGD